MPGWLPVAEIALLASIVPVLVAVIVYTEHPRDTQFVCLQAIAWAAVPRAYSRPCWAALMLAYVLTMVFVPAERAVLSALTALGFSSALIRFVYTL